MERKKTKINDKHSDFEKEVEKLKLFLKTEFSFSEKDLEEKMKVENNEVMVDIHGRSNLAFLGTIIFRYFLIFILEFLSSP